MIRILFCQEIGFLTRGQFYRKVKLRQVSRSVRGIVVLLDLKVAKR